MTRKRAAKLFTEELGYTHLGEKLDIKPFEADMRHLIDTYTSLACAEGATARPCDQCIASGYADG